MNLLEVALTVTFVCAVAACGKDRGDDDTGAHDAAGTGAGGAPVDSSVVACRASVDAARVKCSATLADSAVLCVYDAYRSFCDTGRPVVVKAVFDCLLSEDCALPSDPEDATACVTNVVHTQATPDDHAAGAALCACGFSTGEAACAEMETGEALPDIMLVSDEDERAFTACLGSGCALDDCTNASPLATANQCPGL